MNEGRWRGQPNSSRVRRLAFSLLLTSALCAAPAQPDLVVGHLEGSAEGVRVVYGNQGPGLCHAAHVSIRFLGSPDYRNPIWGELFTLDEQPVPQRPFQVCRSRWIPWSTFGKAAHGQYIALKADIDPRDEIEESQELNNQHYNEVRGVEGEDIPDWERYAGPPDLAVQAVEFVAPHSLRVTVVNRGKGITPVSYCVRFTAKGLKNNIAQFYRRRQPLPIQGQRNYDEFDYRRWGIKLGETVPIKIELDPDNRVRDMNRRNNVVYKTLKFGPSGPMKPPAGQVSGRIGTKPRFQPRSCFAIWIPENEKLSISFFPYALTPQDGELLRLNDGWGVAKRHSKPEHDVYFARLDLQFDHGVQQVDKKKLVRSTWFWVGPHSEAPFAASNDAVPTWKFSPTRLRAGEMLSMDLQDKVSPFEAQIRATTRLVVFPKKVALPDDTDRRLPKDVPPYSVHGTVEFQGRPFHPTSAFATMSPKGEEVTMFLFERPILAEHVPHLLSWNNWHPVVDAVPLDQLAVVQVYFRKSQDFHSPGFEICTKQAGLGGFTAGPEDGLLSPPTAGKPVRFRLKSTSDPKRCRIDVEGTVTLAKPR